MDVQDVAWAFNKQRVLPDEQGLRQFVPQSRLQGKEGVWVSRQYVIAHFRAERDAPIAFHLNDILYHPHRGQVIGGNHEWRVSRVDDLMVWCELFLEKSKQVSLRLPVQS